MTEAKHQNGHLLIVSGSQKAQSSKSVEALDLRKQTIGKGKWKQLPSMQESRAYHGTCCIDGTFLYAFCGRKSNGLIATTEINIERLKLWNASEVWQIVNLKSDLVPAYGINALQMNKHEIVLLGGYSPQSTLNEMQAVNLTDMKTRKVARDSEHTLWTAYFPCVLERPGIAVTIDYSTKSVFEYCHRTEEVRVIGQCP